MYKVTLKTSTKEYKADGNTITEALDKMGLSWNNIKAKGVLSIDKGELHYEQLFQVVKLRKLFGNKLVKVLWSSRLDYLLNCSKDDTKQNTSAKSTGRKVKNKPRSTKADK